MDWARRASGFSPQHTDPAVNQIRHQAIPPRGVNARVDRVRVARQPS
jgi:hypothetical protein